MLSKTSLHSLTPDDVRQFKADVKEVYHCFSVLRQAHINMASLLADPRRNFVISDTMVDDNAELYASIIDLERDFIKYVQKVRLHNPYLLLK